MMKINDIDCLAKHHWKFIKELINISSTREEFLFKEGFKHGYKHCKEEKR